MVVFRMRRLLLILMISLLPLRGWAGEMMAVSMAVQQLSVAVADQKSVAKAVEQAGSPTGAMPADCPMLGPLANNATDADVVGSAISPLCKGFTACQLCMALVTGYPAIPGATAPLPQAEPLVSSVSFTNAEPAPGLKPPIS